MTYYRPLTPDLRRKAIESINGNILELKTCQNNGLVMAQIAAWESVKKLFRALPDGYPVPMEKRREGGE